MHTTTSLHKSHELCKKEFYYRYPVVFISSLVIRCSWFDHSTIYRDSTDLWTDHFFGFWTMYKWSIRVIPLKAIHHLEKWVEEEEKTRESFNGYIASIYRIDRYVLFLFLAPLLSFILSYTRVTTNPTVCVLCSMLKPFFYFWIISLGTTRK